MTLAAASIGELDGGMLPKANRKTNLECQMIGKQDTEITIDYQLMSELYYL